MDPNHGFDQSYDNSVTSSGYNHDAIGVEPSYDVTSGGYNPALVTPSDFPQNAYPAAYPDNAYAPNPANYPNNSAPAQPSPEDIALMLATNNELVQRLKNVELGYNDHVQKEMTAFKEAVEDDFAAVKAQKDAVQAERDVLAAQMQTAIARLEALERAAKAERASKAERTQDPRKRPEPSKAERTQDPRKRPEPSKAERTQDPRKRPAPSKASSANEPTASDRRRSNAHNESTPSPTPTRPSPQTSRSSGSTKAPGASAKPPRASPKPPRPSSNPSGSPTSGARSSSGSPSTPSGSSSKGTKGTQGKNAPKQGTPRKVAEHQMLKGDIDPGARSFKNSFHMHIRLLSGNLDSTSPPASATPDAVQQFERTHQGLTVAELRRRGELGQNIIEPSQVKVGICVEECIRSSSRIVRTFLQLEEGAILHCKSYMAKIGITVWAIDFTQSAYSMYNTAMRMCAIDTFRFLIAGHFYDFLHPDTRYVKDSGLMSQMYDHFAHHYLYAKWALEVRTAGANKTNAERNKFTQARSRLYKVRETYMKDTKVVKRLQLMFSAKATSDDESTPQGPRALARPERSEAADQLVRAVDRLHLEDLLADGKTKAAKHRQRRVAPPFGERNPGYFQEVPKEMPIQYYSPDWFNNRPPQARRKLKAQLTVVFPPGTTNFFHRRGDNLLTQAEMTKKFGDTVFAAYDLDFGTDEAEASGKGVGEDADDEGEGDIVGSEDSEDDSEASDAGSVASFVVDDGASDIDKDADAYGEHDDDMSGEDEDADGEDDDDMSGDAASGEEQGGTWDGKAAFAAEYDVDMSERESSSGEESV
ncbi:hypothetical protein DFH06DRAFT_1345240 [Mycena polygramma]|nr:hypothetical protein DFH06DRAFT_1345240 [Mycena polygramma]